MESPRRQSGWRFVLAAVAVVAIWFFFIQPRSQDLTEAEQTRLLQLARQQLTSTATGGEQAAIDESTFSARLLQPGSAFVTLTVDGDLRGCMVDTFDPHEPLYRNVLRNTILAASADERFSPISPEEVDGIHIAISILGPTEPVEFQTPDELIAQLEPYVDGVILAVDDRLSTYLPEVWESFPDPADFLSHLSKKAGLPPDRWRQSPYPTIQTYRVFRFEEGGSEQ